MGKILIIKGADFSAVAVGSVEPVGSPIITISSEGNVTISCTGAKNIYYTTNNSTPTTNSIKYTSAFSVSSGITVKAIAEFDNGSLSAVASETYRGSTKNYVFGIANSQFLQGTMGYWRQDARGFCLANQSNMQGKTLKGMKMNVSKAGTVHLYKATRNNPSSSDELTQVATATAQDIGIQEIAFNAPISLGAGEYLVIGNKDDVNEPLLSGVYSSSGESVAIEQGFYYNCGTINVKSDGLTPGKTQSLNIDFYY